MQMQLQPAPAPAVPPAADGPEDPPRGCGWFDSSHDLRAGLSVIEHRSADEVSRLVPLGWWLDWQLQECPAAR